MSLQEWGLLSLDLLQLHDPAAGCSGWSEDNRMEFSMHMLANGSTTGAAQSRAAKIYTCPA